jgi:hypothetical protein
MAEGEAMSRMLAAPRTWAALALLILASVAGAQTLEPPPESPEGADYVAEPADSLELGFVEVGMSAAGRAGGSIQRRRRVRYAGDDLSATVREGADDPLAGAVIEREGSGGFSLGRLAPRWGRGLVLGAPAEPWQRTAEDRGRSAFRGRAGEGLWLRHGRDHGIELLAGRFARRDLAGLRTFAGPLALGALAARRGAWQGSLAFARDSGQAELAFDGEGRWRAEGLLERRLGSGRASGHLRAGSEGFRSLAEPGRAGPAQALGVSVSATAGPFRWGALGAMWRFRPALTGARVAAELERPLADGSTLAVGVEEQHGVRRERATPTGSLRQAGWGEWRTAPGPLVVGLRHELWGSRGGLRDPVRTVSSVRVEAHAPLGLVVRLTHSAFRVRRGESLYLPESESDRLLLRAVTGEGMRTRLEMRLPIAGGRIHAALGLSEVRARAARPQWTVDWSRRGRTGRKSARSAGG